MTSSFVKVMFSLICSIFWRCYFYKCLSPARAWFKSHFFSFFK